MTFYENQLFHIYNQGNNRRQVFLSDENYQFFIWKMRAYLLPFGDLIAWALMPNHFHWLFFVRKIEIPRKELWEHVDKVEFERRTKKYGLKAQSVKTKSTRNVDKDLPITLNLAIGNLEKSYSKAFNKETEQTGSVFRKNAKAKDGWLNEFITVTKNNGQADYRFLPGSNYGYQCLCYIHDNPKKADLVSNNTDWPFSSAKDYAGLRNGTLCNLKLGRELIDFI